MLPYNAREHGRIRQKEIRTHLYSLSLVMAKRKVASQKKVSPLPHLKHMNFLVKYIFLSASVFLSLSFSVFLSLSLKLQAPIKCPPSSLMAATWQLHKLKDRNTVMCYFPRRVFTSTERLYVGEEMKAVESAREVFGVTCLNKIKPQAASHFLLGQRSEPHWMAVDICGSERKIWLGCRQVQEERG